MISGRDRSEIPGVGALRFLPGGAPRRGLLLLRPGPGLRPGVHQDLHLLPVSGEGLAQRARVGQTPSHPARDRVHARCPTGSRAPLQPGRLQAICDTLAPDHVQAFFDRWITQIPTPFTAEDRAAGYWWELSMRQVEVSRTLVFDDPRRARSFFEALVQDNIGIGRPEEVALVFARQLRRPTRHPYRTRIFSPGTEVKIDFRYKHSRVKQYLKDGRALRIETVINKPGDLDVLARLQHLPELVSQSPPGQPPAAYDRACRSELCHRLCAL